MRPSSQMMFGVGIDPVGVNQGPEWRMQIVTRSMAILTEARCEGGEQ